MERKDFLKGLGLLSLTTVALPTVTSCKKDEEEDTTAINDDCTLIPSETTGPYPLDLSSDSSKFRSDIRESEVGAETKVKLKIVNLTCEPIQNARVDIWHCNAYGYYSGYTTSGQNGSKNYVGQTWLRGIQMTDANGEVEFTTIFPGWYSGRVTHIHFQVYLSSVLQVTSQLTFPIAAKNALYASNEPYSAYGDDPASLSSDNVFSDGYAIQMATLTKNETSGVYEVYLQAKVNSSKTTGLLKLEPETGGQFKLHQNFLNPYQQATRIPFSLVSVSDVKIELFNLMGIKVAEVSKPGLSSGPQEIEINTNELGIASANYIYQIEVNNSNGAFRQCKMMTLG